MAFNIDKKIEPPIYFYYELNNFFQNHRVYLESKDEDQLKGQDKAKVYLF